MRPWTRALVVALLAVAPLRANAETHGVTFRSNNLGEEVSFFGLGPRGFLRSGELDVLSHIMRCRRTGRQRRIHPVLARSLVRAARHFRRPVVVVSGYRAVQRHGRRRSQHLAGRAADVYVHGVAPLALRDWAVQSGVRGIGFYPNSGFVHLDVRDRRYWWVDYSGPGRPSRIIADPEGSAPEVEGGASRRASR